MLFIEWLQLVASLTSKSTCATHPASLHHIALLLNTPIQQKPATSISRPGLHARLLHPIASSHPAWTTMVIC